MSLRRFIKSFVGRKAKASRNGTPGSHVNHKANKRTASKAGRKFSLFDDWEDKYFERDDYNKE